MDDADDEPIKKRSKATDGDGLEDSDDEDDDDDDEDDYDDVEEHHQDEENNDHGRVHLRTQATTMNFVCDVLHEPNKAPS